MEDVHAAALADGSRDGPLVDFEFSTKSLHEPIDIRRRQRDDDVDVEAVSGRVDVSGLRTTTRISGGELLDQLRVNTLDGDDEVAVDDEVDDILGIVVDLGPGEI